MRKALTCPECGSSYDARLGRLICGKCGTPLLPQVPDTTSTCGEAGIWAWRDSLVTGVFDRRVTLYEGMTPLIRAHSLERTLGIGEVLLKDESRNPTGTFIDRGAATAVTAALNLKVMRLVTASLGDLGISIATYARRAGIRCKVLIPATAPPVKTYQTLALADSVEFVEDYERAVHKAERYGSKAGSMPVTARNPYLIDGYRTLALELLEEIKGRNSVVLVPVGDGALAWATCQVLSRFASDVRVIGVRVSSTSPLLKDVAVRKPLLLDLLKDALVSVGGFILEVSEADVIEASKTLASAEGLLIEPTGVTAVAALLKYSEEFYKTSKVVAVVTGGPARDPAVLSMIAESKSLRDVQRVGFTKMKILEVVAMQGPIHPYATWKILTSRYGLKISLRSIYQHFNELLGMGLIKVVESSGERRRRLFKITEKGIEYIRR